MAFWQRHAPSAIYPKFRQQMERLTMGAFPWRLIGIGEPLQAVAFFLWGCARVWYFASAHHQSHPQAITKILAYAIMGAIAEGKTFDFMGSVLPGVERFFWQFGGTWETRYVLQTPWLSFFSR
jgi:predicted transcriptional regulator